MWKNSFYNVKNKLILPKYHEIILAYLFVTPVLILVGIIFIYPTLFNIYISLHEWNWSTPLDIPKPFIGLQNYLLLINSSRFLNSLKISVLLVIFAVSVEYVLGLGLALVLNKQFKGRSFFRALFIIPMMLAPIVIAIQWRYLISGSFGILPYFIGFLGFESPLFLSEPRWGLPILILVDSWIFIPFVALILLAGLQQIPEDVYDAAKVDGGSAFDQFRYITLPYLKAATALVLLLRAGEVFRAFDLVFILTGGGPIRVTEVMGIFLYKTAFVQGDLGLAAALGLIIALIGMLFGAVIINLIRTEVRLF